MMDTVRVWQTGAGLRVDRHLEGLNVRALIWPRDGKFRAFRGEFKTTPEGACPGEKGWLCIGFRDETLDTLRGAIFWATEGWDVAPGVDRS